MGAVVGADVSTASASSRCPRVDTHGTPAFMIPAFSRAIFSSVSPSIATWSTARCAHGEEGAMAGRGVRGVEEAEEGRQVEGKERQTERRGWEEGEGILLSRSVMPQTTGDGRAFVASSRPPMPTSTTAASTPSACSLRRREEGGGRREEGPDGQDWRGSMSLQEEGGEDDVGFGEEGG
jgi:hypothetical protein